MTSNLLMMIGKDEKILWRAKPNKKCYILEAIFNPFLPFALIWLLLDSFFIGSAILSAISGHHGEALTEFLFLAFHLLPVWLYLGGILFVHRKYRHTEYIITDKGVYVSGGLFSYTCEMKPFTEISHISIHRGIIDQYIGVGDIILSTPNLVSSVGYQNTNRNVFQGLIIADIPDYQKVFGLLKNLQTDIYSDTMYPNALRPSENNGYKTQYNPNK